VGRAEQSFEDLPDDSERRHLSSITTDDWSAGKNLHYATGIGSPDSEGITKADFASPFIYVSTERDNNNSGVSRLSILRYDTSAPGTELTAVMDWNVTADLPPAGNSNLGLEAITYVPDSYLVSHQFLDESTGQAYDPSRYPNHEGGIFIVGFETNGVLYAYALDHVSNAFQRVATIASGFPSVMDLEFDRDVGNLWAVCDNTCGGSTTVLQIDTAASSPTRGRFRIQRGYQRPSTLPDSNNEGFAIAPESECSGGQKSVFWADDAEFGGHWLRRDTIPCGPLF
jgi:hypothetical protein